MPDQLVRASNGVALKSLKDMGTGTHAEVIFLGGGDSANPIPTFEQAAMGYDPSTGRTPVEQTNNCDFAALTTGTATKIIKAAPGFLHSVSISVLCASAVAGCTHLALYDNTTATGTALLHLIPIPAPNTGPVYVPMDVIFATGYCIATCTVTPGTATVVNTVPTASPAATIVVVSSYR